jgi:hypothetical protein
MILVIAASGSLLIPEDNLIGRGEVSVVLIADGKTANPVKINIAGQATH